jgi:hypothetical protein
VAETEPSADEHERERERNEVLREAVTMALYVSLSQLAVLTALPHDQATEDATLAWTIALTSVGLVLAHQIAFRMSSRLITKGSALEPIAPRILRAQLLGGLVVTLLAVVPVLVLGSGALRLSMALLLLFVMVVGYAVARSAPSSRLRSLVYVAGVVVLVGIVLAVKSLVGH